MAWSVLGTEVSGRSGVFPSVGSGNVERLAGGAAVRGAPAQRRLSMDGRRDDQPEVAAGAPRARTGTDDPPQPARRGHPDEGRAPWRATEDQVLGPASAVADLNRRKSETRRAGEASALPCCNRCPRRRCEQHDPDAGKTAAAIGLQSPAAGNRRRSAGDDPAAANDRRRCSRTRSRGSGSRPASTFACHDTFGARTDRDHCGGGDDERPGSAGDGHDFFRSGAHCNTCPVRSERLRSVLDDGRCMCR